MDLLQAIKALPESIELENVTLKFKDSCGLQLGLDFRLLIRRSLVRAQVEEPEFSKKINDLGKQKTRFLRVFCFCTVFQHDSVRIESFFNITCC
jgi:hypothetical protein